MDKETGLWYFAYGANMARAVLHRRQVQPGESRAARLDDYVLRFNHPGAPPIEPVFAGIEPCPGATVYGVAHRITPAEAAIFDSLEPGYHRVTLAVHLADETAVAAFAYASDTPGPDGIPSARYLGLLIAGAREFDLPANVIAEWERLQTLASAASATPRDVLPNTLAALAQSRNFPLDLLAQWQRESQDPPGAPAPE
jgi:hypothetical protein